MRRWKRIASAALVAAPLWAAGCVPGVAVPDDAQAPAQSGALLPCPGYLPPLAFTVAPGDAPPQCSSGFWIADLPAQAAPADVRRSEVQVFNVNGPVIAHPGQVLVHDESFAGELGPAAASDTQWHVLWQLHGPVHGHWRGPAMGLAVRNGQVRLGGGDGHEGQDYRTRNYEWTVPLGSYEDDRIIHVRIETYLSSDPNAGWVSAWFDGRQVLDHWQPTSPMGLRPGTVYDGQNVLSSRIGLYRGAQGTPPPQTRQWAGHAVWEAGAH